MIDPKYITSQIKAAANEILPDLVFNNITVANLFTDEFEQADVAIHNGKFVGVGTYKGKQEIDGSPYTMVPGLIDAHVHIESSMLAPAQFEKAVLPHGVTTVVTDPHEIANVTGQKGIEWMLEESKKCVMNIRYQMPSCVPATSFEDNGAYLTAKELTPFYNHPNVLGLAEVMDFPAVLSCQDEMMEKLAAAASYGVPIDGHGAGLSGKQINAYMAAGITTDHECVNKDEMLERVRRGMYVMLREGSAARNLHALLEGYNGTISRRLLFCTDDKHIDDLMEEGSIDFHVRECLKMGIDFFSVMRMASLNTAECFGLKGKGAIAPGFDADFLLLRDIETFDIASVWVDGTVYEEQDKEQAVQIYDNTVNLGSYHIDKLKLSLCEKKARVIEIIPNSIVTKESIVELTPESGLFEPDAGRDLVKMAVVERHKGSGMAGTGIVKGFQLRRGAVSTTIAHDSHNIICIGMNDADMDIAIKEMERTGGGIAVVQDGSVTASLSLPIGGLMTNISPRELNEAYGNVITALKNLGITEDFSPLLTLSFLALPVIPSLKLTNRGLFDVDRFAFVDVGVKE